MADPIRPGARGPILASMYRLDADIWKKVHPLFWPVLWWNLRWFTAYNQREIDAGRGNNVVVYRVTRYGQIIIERVIARHWREALAPYVTRAQRLLNEDPSSPDLIGRPITRSCRMADREILPCHTSASWIPEPAPMMTGVRGPPGLQSPANRTT